MAINLNYNPACKKQTGFGKKKQSDINFERNIFFKEKTKPKKSNIPLWSSMLVPGLGQFMNKQPGKGGLAFILGLPMAVFAGLSRFLTKNNKKTNIQNIGKAIAGIAVVTYCVDLIAASIDAHKNTEILNKLNKKDSR